MKLNKKTITWAALKAAFLQWIKRYNFRNILQREITKQILKKLAISGGIKGWLISFVVGHLIEAGDEYILEPLMVIFGYKKEVKDGKKVYSKLASAKDIDEWRDAANDV